MTLRFLTLVVLWAAITGMLVRQLPPVLEHVRTYQHQQQAQLDQLDQQLAQLDPEAVQP